MSTAEPLLRVEDLVVTSTNRQRSVTLVDGVSFEVPRGAAMGLVGESGSGKSLTLRALLGLLPAGVEVTSGRVLVDGQDVAAMGSAQRRGVRGSQVGMVFQDPMTALNPVMTVGDQIAEGPRVKLGMSRRAAARLAVDLMSQVGISDAERRARAYPHEFSGGMRQRVMIAISLACSPALLLCDEPTTALDVTIQQQILHILDDLRAERDLAVVFVTHDLAVVAELCEQVSVMYAGRLVESGPTAEVFRRPQHGYTLGLLRSAPDLHSVRPRLEAIPGLPPDPERQPPGCRFEPRCGFADPSCGETRDYPLLPVGEQRYSACVHAEDVLGSVERTPVIAGA